MQITNTDEGKIKQSASVIEDYDPLVAISITIDILEIRELEEIDHG